MMGCGPSRSLRLEKGFADAPFADKVRFEIDAYVGSVYDGDTFTVSVVESGQVMRRRCRLEGVDTPEMKPRLTILNRERHIERAKQAKQFVERNVLHRHVRLRVSGYDKYGRWLVRVQCKGMDLSDLLIAGEYGVPYDGGTKIKP